MRSRIESSCGGSRRKAFTLIEILAVVVILGITSAVVIPQLSSRDDLKLSSGARTLMADLLYTQSRAIARQKVQYMVFNTTSMKYDVMDSISPQNIISHPLTGATYEMVFGNAPLGGVSLSSVSFDGQTTLAFDQLGVPYPCAGGVKSSTPMNAGSIVLQCGTNQITVSVQPYSGEIKVQ